MFGRCGALIKTIRSRLRLLRAPRRTRRVVNKRWREPNGTERNDGRRRFCRGQQVGPPPPPPSSEAPSGVRVSVCCARVRTCACAACVRVATGRQCVCCTVTVRACCIVSARARARLVRPSVPPSSLFSVRNSPVSFIRVFRTRCADYVRSF